VFAHKTFALARPGWPTTGGVRAISGISSDTLDLVAGALRDTSDGLNASEGLHALVSHA
jgi:hypothetical protein